MICLIKSKGLAFVAYQSDNNVDLTKLVGNKVKIIGKYLDEYVNKIYKVITVEYYTINNIPGNDIGLLLKH